MNSTWFIIGFVMVALGIFGYIIADDQVYKAKAGLFSGRTTLGDIHDLERSKLIAIGFGIVGGLFCLAGIAMSDESEKPKKESWEEWLDDDFTEEMPDKDNGDLDSIIVHPKKDDESHE